MISQAFSVYDSKAEAFLPPFFTSTPALAMRSFAEAANNSEHNFHRYAGDFTLFHIGVFDDSKGELVPLKAHGNLGTALTFIVRPESPEIPLELLRSERGQ